MSSRLSDTAWEDAEKVDHPAFFGVADAAIAVALLPGDDVTLVSLEELAPITPVVFGVDTLTETWFAG